MAMTKSGPFTTTSQRVAYQTPWLTIREDAIIRPNGQPGIYSVLELPACAAVLPIAEDGRIWLVRQWRYPLARWSWELPMGRVDPGETVRQAAERELGEETGLQAADWQELGTCTALDGLSSGWLTAFVARNLSGQPQPMDDEVEQVAAFNLTEIDGLMDHNELFDGETLSTLWLAQRRGVL
jgi:8-oxo-dGTP pyrophosphatase MutT (NUDIX family)